MAGMTVPQLGDLIGKEFVVHSRAASWCLSCSSRILPLISKQDAPDRPTRLIHLASLASLASVGVLHWSCVESIARERDHSPSLLASGSRINVSACESAS